MSERLTWAQVKERFADEARFEMQYYEGDAAGAIRYTPIGEQAKLEPHTAFYVWDPMEDGFDWDDTKSGLFLRVKKRKDQDA